jgi:hypothetical protein
VGEKKERSKLRTHKRILQVVLVWPFEIPRDFCHNGEKVYSVSTKELVVIHDIIDF